MISESMRFLAQPREMSPIWVGMVLDRVMLGD